MRSKLIGCLLLVIATLAAGPLRAQPYRQFLESAIDTSEEFAAFLKADRERVGQLVKKFNIPKQ